MYELEKEAVETLKTIVADNGKQLRALIFAVEYIEKGMAEKPVKHYKRYSCPKCGRFLKTTEDGYKTIGTSRCPDCNQTIDWMHCYMEDI